MRASDRDIYVVVAVLSFIRRHGPDGFRPTDIKLPNGNAIPSTDVLKVLGALARCNLATVYAEHAEVGKPVHLYEDARYYVTGF